MRNCKVNKQDLGVIPYGEALNLQRKIFSEVQDGDEGVLLLLEHPHVYTLGKSGHENNLLINDDFMASIGAEYFKTDRGGDITYHGYGQLVAYPIIDLNKVGVSLRRYIELLEEAIILTVGEYGIEAGRVEGATGVWVEGHSATKARKIAAIGVRASRGVTMHGMALNVTTDLKYFSYINPCGMADKGVTSIEKEAGEVSMDEVKEMFAANFAKLFDVSVY